MHKVTKCKSHGINNNNNNISLFQSRGPYRRDHRQKSTNWVSHTVAQFAHDHGEEQNTLSSPHLYCYSQERKKWLVIQ